MLCAARGVLAVLIAGAPALGQTKSWDGEAGDLRWFGDANWSPDGVPGAGDSVVVHATGPVVAQSNTINVLSVLVGSGLVVDSAGLVLGGDSRITGLTVQGCCTAVVDTSGVLTIDGVSAFLKGVRFQGVGSATVAGTAFFDDDLFVEGGHVVTIAGEASSDDNIDPRNGSEVVIEGTLGLLPGAAIRGSAGGLTRNRGVVKSVGAGEVWVFGTLATENGTVRAEQGVLHLSGDIPVDHGTLEALPGAELVLDSGAASEISYATIQGGGDVTLRSGSVLYTGRTESHVEQPGTLELRGRCRIDGLFVNSGDATFFGPTLESPSGLGEFETRGFVDVTAGTTLRMPVWVRDGGTLRVRAGLSLQADLTVEEGGLLLIDDGLGALSGQPGVAQINGLLKVSAPDSEIVTLSAPVYLHAGGRVKVDSGTAQLRSDLVWGGGTLEATGVSTSVVVGEFGRRLSVVGDVGLVGDCGSVTFGPSQHTVEILGTLHNSVRSPGGEGVAIASRITGGGTLVNDGALRIWQNAQMEASIANSGELRLSGPLPLRAVLSNSGRVTQLGDLSFDQGSVVNSGTWEAVVSGGSSWQHQVDQGLITNNGLYEVLREGDGEYTHTVGVRFDNQGTVRATGATARFEDAAQLVGDVLAGGTWEAEFGGRIEFPGTTIAAIATGSRVIGSTDSLPWMSGAPRIDGGAWEVRGDSALGLPLEVSGGAVDVESGETHAPKIDVRDGGRLGVGDGTKVRSDDRIKIHSVIDDIDGIASIGLLPAPAVIETPLVDLGGRMLPGGDGRAGRFDIIGDVSCAPGARMAFDVGGEDNTDVVTVTGSVALSDSALAVGLIDEHRPQEGDRYTLVEAAGGVRGRFLTQDLPALGAGLAWEVSYTATAVELAVVGACRADWNADGQVNTIDFLAYLGDWSAQQHSDCSGGGCGADLNGDGIVDTQDFLAFLGAWAQGC